MGSINIEKLRQICPDGVFENVSLATLSHWKIGGSAQCIIRPTSILQIQQLVSFFKETDQPYLILGHTTNLLFNDEGVKVPIIQIGNQFSNISIEDENVVCQSGTWVPFLARKVALASLSGVEHICGIPGTFGGLICMNGGSLRRGIGENITAVKTINGSGKVCSYSQHECEFAYRTSRFQSANEIIVEATLKLEKSNKEAIRHNMLEILGSRRRKFPRKLPNCGSVFVSNPAMYEKYGPPGKVIEDLGLKGSKKGAALVSPIHANFIVNTGDATASDVLYLIHLCRSKVLLKTGYDMISEARYISPDGTISPAHYEAELMWGHEIV